MVQLWYRIGKWHERYWGAGVYTFYFAGLLALAGNQKDYIPAKMLLPVFSAGVINICIIAYLIIRWESAMSGVSNESVAFGNIGLSVGIWAAIARAIVVAFGAYRFRSADSNIKNSFRSLKTDVDKAISDKGKGSNTIPSQS